MAEAEAIVAKLSVLDQRKLMMMEGVWTPEKPTPEQTSWKTSLNLDPEEVKKYATLAAEKRIARGESCSVVAISKFSL
ncbi:hypothetical protein AB1Y20_006189 [Prymnesium parvum]|uniref:Uncharacterized protein n=1 Tax=Prymnesium parvum TaxID=97485 RepID=A0AB34J3Z2_PRYPA